MNTCHRYIWYEKQGKVLFVIQYQCNVSVSLPLASIDTNSTILPSASLPTMTMKEMTTEMILNTGMEADATSGKENVWKKFVYNTFVWKYPSSDISKIERYVKDI